MGPETWHAGQQGHLGPELSQLPGTSPPLSTFEKSSMLIFLENISSNQRSIHLWLNKRARKVEGTGLSLAHRSSDARTPPYQPRTLFFEATTNLFVPRVSSPTVEYHSKLHSKDCSRPLNCNRKIFAQLQSNRYIFGMAY